MPKAWPPEFRRRPVELALRLTGLLRKPPAPARVFYMAGCWRVVTVTRVRGGLRPYGLLGAGARRDCRRRSAPHPER